jgi:hypothetical protein
MGVNTERRRLLRATVGEPHELTFEASIPVQVLDISLSGVLLASRSPLAIGDCAELKATLGRRTIHLVVEVRRISVDHNPPRGGARYRAGAVFAPMSAEQRVELEQLLGAEPT